MRPLQLFVYDMVYVSTKFWFRPLWVFPCPSNSVPGSISKESSISERTSVPPSPKDVPEIYLKNKPNKTRRKIN